MKNLLARTVTLLALAVAFCSTVCIAPSSASAQAALSEELGGLSWGASMEDVLAVKREQILDEYRAEIAGLRDPIEIDRLRRIADEEFNTIEASIREFDGVRTGFEVSVIQDEVQPGVGQSMVAVRAEWSTEYYVFHNDRLAKLLVTYDQASLNFLGFEAFVERLEGVFGGPDATDWRVDDIGVRHMTRASWQDVDTRVRVEDKSSMFASYLLVYSDLTIADTPTESAVAGQANRPTNTRNIGSLIRRMDEDTEGTRDNSSVVDSIIGAPTDVQLRLRVEEGAIAGASSPDGGSVLDDDEVLEDAERRERPSRPSRSSGEEEEEEEETGGIIY